jgi:hypothetical protein
LAILLAIYLAACSAPAPSLHIDTMLRRLHRQAVEDVGEGKLERKKSKRQRIVEFFRSRKGKTQGGGEVPVCVLSVIFRSESVLYANRVILGKGPHRS